MNRARQFVSERCEIRPDLSIKPRELCRAYHAFDLEGGEKPLTETTFGIRMKDLGAELGFQKTKSGERLYRGKGLRECAV